MRRTTIYIDTALSYLHNPDFGSMENGARVKFNTKPYEEDGWMVKSQTSFHKLGHYTLAIDNPIITYLRTTHFEKNWWERILGRCPSALRVRNCHGCTMESTTLVCSMCGTTRSEAQFYRYVHKLDSSVSDGDSTYVCHTSLEAVGRSVSIVCSMLEDIYKAITRHSFCLVRPPGHHASHHKSEGFCLVNNIGIGIEYVISKGWFRKVFIFDFDVHHGNDTQAMFYERADVFYCSIHTLETYPKTGLETETGVGPGLGFTLNLVMPKGTDDKSYLAIFHSKVIPAIRSYGPDLIVVSAGFDALATDPMKIMALTPQCYGQMATELGNIGCPVAMVLEGGYDLNALSLCYDECIRGLN